MKFNELPQEWQEKLLEERKNLHKRNHIGKSSVTLYNKEGTRFFWASYSSRSRYEPAHWSVSYGAVQFTREYDFSRNESYVWTWGKRFNQSLNGTHIPRWVDTRKDVLELVDKIGIFEYEKK